VKIRFLGAHNTQSRQAGMTSLLIDDVLAIDAGNLTAALSFRSQMKLKAVLLTHQHYDHVRDLPALAMSLYERNCSLMVYAPLPVGDALKKTLFGGGLYPNFFEPRNGRRVMSLETLDPHQVRHILDYNVLAVPVIHSVPTVGYQVTAGHGESLFYTGDTGPGLFESWRHVSPHLLIVDLTASDSYEDAERESGHLTPGLLKSELETFKHLKGYIPRVVAVHMSPALEPEIVPELKKVAADLAADISLAREGLEIDLPAP
jgi:ribonuclease BN (tRNA processing enzyme)